MVEHSPKILACKEKATTITHSSLFKTLKSALLLNHLQSLVVKRGRGFSHSSLPAGKRNHPLLINETCVLMFPSYGLPRCTVSEGMLV